MSNSNALQRLQPGLDEKHLRMEFEPVPCPTLWDSVSLDKMNQSSELFAETNSD